jgi:hypothetical protein
LKQLVLAAAPDAEIFSALVAAETDAGTSSGKGEP